MICYWTSRRIILIPLSIEESSANAFCARMPKGLSTSTCNIVLRPTLERDPTTSTWRRDWEENWTREAAVKQFYNAKNERKRDLESLKKHSNMLYIMVKRTRSRKELKKIKNIRSKVDNKYDYSNRSRFSSNTESYLLRDNEWDIRQPDERNETKKLYQIVANNIKNKDQRNNSIDYEPNFDNKFIYLVIQI